MFRFTAAASLVGASLGTLAWSAAAVAQPGPPVAAPGAPEPTAPTDAVNTTASNPSGPPAATDEIVVTARRRQEDISRVPIAITAIGADQLASRAIRTDSDLQISAPGLTIRQTQGNNSLTYSLRGQSADTFSGSPAAVITYLNEVPLTVSGASTFYDLDSVQVLKGPQGTLFGRNATGGAVLYTSAKPTDELGAFARVRLGNLALREGEGMVNLPIVDDKVLLRGAFDIVRRDGYVHNLYDGRDLGANRREGGRVSLTLKPVAGLTNTSIVQYGHSGGTNTGASYTYSVYPCGATNNGFALTCASGLLFGPGLDSVAGRGAYAAYLAAHPKAYPPGLLAYPAEQRRLGYHTTNYPGDAGFHGRDWNVSNTTVADLGGDLQVKNIFGFSRSYTRSDAAELGAPFVTILTANAAAGQIGNRLNVHSISDEPQLLGKALGGNLTFIVGAYFQRQRADTLWPQTYFDVSPIIPPSYVTNNFRTRTTSRAIYAQGTYDLGALGLDNLRFTAGLRYTRERLGIEQLPRSTYTFGAPNQARTFRDPSWEVGLEYQATPQLFTYLKTRGSFRSGGFNGAAPPINATATGGGNIFGSEHTQDIEGGIKYRGRLLGRPVTLNLALYNQWIQDVQRVEFPDPDGPGGLTSIAVTANIPSERVRGLEAEASVGLADWLTLGGLLAYTDAKFTNGRIVLFGTNFQYGPVGDTPKLSGTAYAQVTVPVAERIGKVTGRAEAYAQTGQYFSNTGNSIGPGTFIPGYTLVNARVAWDRMFGTGAGVALFARNLANRDYFTGGFTLAAALGHNAATVGEPRTYGVELSYRF